MNNVTRLLAAGAVAASGTAIFGASLVLPAAVGLMSGIRPAYAACAPGVKIDKSTVADARKDMQKAGYTDVRDLKKGCDNYWHGVATKDGKQTHVVATPDGKVMPEGD